MLFFAVALPSRVDAQAGNREVLDQMESGTLAFHSGNVPKAEADFDFALNAIEAVWANTESAQRARSLWHNEGEKDFKGEPYERLMAYYYRGLLYLTKDDFENASASFKGGLIQDGFAEEEQYRSNFALLMLLDGWTHQCRGSYKDAMDHYAEAKALRPDYTFPAQQDTVLVILETGKSPRKVSDGVGHGELKFFRGRNFTETRAQLVAGSATYNLYPIEDIFLKASTRGGRPIDAIIQGKVMFRQNTEAVGTVLSDVARTAILAAPIYPSGTAGAMTAVGGGLAVASAISLALAANAGTQVDIRYWGSLPDAIHVMTMAKLPSDSLAAAYFDASGNRVEDPQIQSTVQTFGNKCTLVWGRSRIPQPAPPPLQ